MIDLAKIMKRDLMNPVFRAIHLDAPVFAEYDEISPIGEERRIQ